MENRFQIQHILFLKCHGQWLYTMKDEKKKVLKRFTQKKMSKAQLGPIEPETSSS